MTLHRLTAFILFVRLHHSLLMKAGCVDMAFLILGIGYMFIPPSESIFSISNGIFLFITILVFVALQVGLLRSHTGGVAFYRQLPVPGTIWLLAAKAVSVIPFVVLLSIAALIITIIAVVMPSHHIPSYETILIRFFHVGAIFIAMKSYVVPTMLLSDKHPMYLGLFYVSLVPVILCVMAFHEFFFMHLRCAPVWDLGMVLFLLTVIELWTIRNAK